MNGSRFDGLLRAVNADGSRRHALRALAVGGFASVFGGPHAAVGQGKKRRKRPRCPQCPQCPQCPTCPAPPGCPSVAFCADKDDLTACANGKTCMGGICAPEATCQGFTDRCTGDGECCSGNCNPSRGQCLCSPERERCHDDGDCCLNPPGLACVGFVCVQT